MYKERFMIGLSGNFQNVCEVYPVTIEQMLTQEEVFVYKKLLTITQGEIEDTAEKPEDYLTPLEYLFNLAYNSKEFLEIVERAFFFFTREPVTLLFNEKRILIGQIEGYKDVAEFRFLSEENYPEFQNMIRVSFGDDKVEEYEVHSDNPRVRAMKAQVRERERIKAKQAAKSGEALEIVTLMNAVICMGLGITPFNVKDLTFFALRNIQAMSSAKEKYYIDMDSIMAGAKYKEVNPTHWIKNKK